MQAELGILADPEARKIPITNYDYELKGVPHKVCDNLTAPVGPQDFSRSQHYSPIRKPVIPEKRK